MSGTTIGNWGKFEKNLFKGMSGIPDKDVKKITNDETGVLSARLSEVKSGHLHASTVKKFFLGILTFGIYNICHGISAKNQRATKAALKEGVDNVHCALSYLSTVCQKDVQEKGAGAQIASFNEKYVKTAPDIRPYTQADKDFLAGTNCRLMEKHGDPDFPSGQFIRTTMGGVQVDIGLVGGQSAKVRIKDGDGKGKDAIVVLPSVEDALYALEKDIVRDTEIFGGNMVEKMLTRYDKRLELEKTVNGADSVGVPRRESIKNRQMELSRDILSVRYGMSGERLAYLDRDMAKQLAIQAIKENITSGPALDAHYDKIVSQRHLVGEDMMSLYGKLEAAGDMEARIHLPKAAPQGAIGEGRPTAKQQKIHNFAADLILAEDISEYDKDIGKSGYLDGKRLRNVFAKHHDTIAALMTERAANKNAVPTALASLDPSMQEAVVKLLDTLLDNQAKTIARVGREMTPDQYLDRLVKDFDAQVAKERQNGKGSLNEIDDYSQKRQFNEAGIGSSENDAYTLKKEMSDKNVSEADVFFAVEEHEEKDKVYDYRRHGKANFFAQIELELNKSIEEAMKQSVQSQVKTMLANVFPQENPDAMNSASSLDTIVADRASDPQMKLLKATLNVYFEKMSGPDQRNMMARLVRHTVAGASDGIRFGELLKGAGPLLQKMMQGLDPDAFTDPNFRLAIDDMRSKLAPIPEKAVKAQLADIIARSNGTIESITIKNALGAASVAQTFLCSIKLQGEAEPRECVIKMLRPDAHLRALREAEVFREVAKGIKGMSLTFEGTLSGIMKELDLTLEADNVKAGLDVYDAGTAKVNKTFTNVSSMRLSEIPGTEPTKGLMVLERAPGVPMDKFLKDTNEAIAANKASVIDGIANRSKDDAIVSMLDGAEKLTNIYEDTLAKHDALSNLTTIWIREGLFTKTGFYHGDLHAGNIMVPTADDIAHGVPNGVTMIDFGNATKLTSEDQKNVIRVIAGAAGNAPDLFLKGFEALLSDAGKAKLAQNRQAVEQIVRDILGKGTGNDTGKRMTAVFKLLQTKYSIEVPPTISGFQSSQERLTIAMESMLRMMTSAEMARLDVILATAKEEGADVSEIGNDVPPAQAFAQKKEAAIAYINEKLTGDLTEDVREKLETLKTKLDEADAHRPLSMMQCMVGVIKQNIVSSLRTLGVGSARTVTDNLTADGIIGNDDNGPDAAPKERRFIEIWP
jgi:predicted unusual protein kinase regulating ubiquinone biosynthesis (AarF/ABC1/UbiB family)